MFENQYISLELISAKLNLPEKYLSELVIQGKIPYLSVGKRKRFKEQAVRTALNRIEIMPKSQAIHQTILDSL